MLGVPANGCLRQIANNYACARRERKARERLWSNTNISISQVLNMWNHCFFSLLCVCVNALLCVHYTSLLQSLGCKFYYWYIHTSLLEMWRDPVARDPTGLARTWRYPRKVLCNVYIRAAQLIFKNSLQLSLLKTVFLPCLRQTRL